MDSPPDTEIITTDPVSTHITPHESITTEIVSAIADARECEIDSLDPVSEAIILEAFDSLYANSEKLTQTNLTIEFTVADRRVILYGDGLIVAVSAGDYPSNSRIEERSVAESGEGE